MVGSREALQTEALNEWLKLRRGLLVLPTGTGKTKVAIDAIKTIKPRKVLVIVPTEKLRDVTWPDELKKWGLKKKLEIVCYASLAKIKRRTFDLVIMDEAHRITENNRVFFENNKVKYVLGMTATNPKDKYDLLKDICPIVYSASLDQAIDAGAVADYEIEIIYLNLDDKEKYISAGNAKNRFLTTEVGQYKFLNQRINKMRYSGKDVPEFFYMNRMRFIYNLRSKTRLAKDLIERLPEQERLLIFCGSIEQAEEVCDNFYHSKSNDTALSNFITGKINKLSAVKALNEGINIPKIDAALIVQLNSKELDLVQRIGRVLRTDKSKPAKVYILVSIGTQDEVWANKATAYFDQTKIKKTYYGR